jgi:hypothetical protein
MNRSAIKWSRIESKREKEILMMISKTRRSIGTTIAQLLVLMLIGLACTTSSSINNAKAATGSTDLVGTWVGSGMTLTIDSSQVQDNTDSSQVQDVTFEGTLTQPLPDTTIYSVIVNGILDSDNSAITFMRFKNMDGSVTNTFVNIVYSGYISNGTMTGLWIIPPGLPSTNALVGTSGNFSLKKQ